MRSETIAAIAEALSKAQGEVSNPPRNRTVTVRTKTNASYQFSYTTLDVLLETVRPVLSKHGLAIVQTIEGDTVETLLLHISGEYVGSSTPIMVSERSAQAYGSGVTYARRYAIAGLLGIASDEDDDANAADGNDVSPATTKKKPRVNGKLLSKLTEEINEIDNLDQLSAFVNRLGNDTTVNEPTKEAIYKLGRARWKVLQTSESETATTG